MRRAHLLLLLAIGGCASGGRVSEADNPLPVNYRADLLAFLRTYLNDPTHVREAALSAPALRAVGGEMRYVACVRYNARDTLGKYSGTKDRMAVYYRGRFDTLVEGAAGPCKDAAYAPFPELERLTR